MCSCVFVQHVRVCEHIYFVSKQPRCGCAHWRGACCGTCSPFAVAAARFHRTEIIPNLENAFKQQSRTYANKNIHTRHTTGGGTDDIRHTHNALLQSENKQVTCKHLFHIHTHVPRSHRQRSSAVCYALVWSLCFIVIRILYSCAASCEYE